MTSTSETSPQAAFATTETKSAPTSAASKKIFPCYSSKITRVFALTAAAYALIFVANNFLIFVGGWPGLNILAAHYGWFGLETLSTPLSGKSIALGWLQIAFYAGALVFAIIYVQKTPEQKQETEGESLTRLSLFITRWAFWSILLIGLVDATISFYRVEGALVDLVGSDIARQLGRASYRGLMTQLPLMVVGFVIALFTRTLGFTWLALLIVFAELQIVIARFVFSYEQAFMGDLVRFWYAGLFLFASAYTLQQEGHVRVDILYAGFSERVKAWSNTIGSLFLGIPICWIVLNRGLWGKSNLINAPLLNFEISQSGYGMYVKYLMGGFLIIYAVTMLIQFSSYLLHNVAVLIGEKNAHVDPEDQII